MYIKRNIEMSKCVLSRFAIVGMANIGQQKGLNKSPYLPAFWKQLCPARVSLVPRYTRTPKISLVMNLTINGYLFNSILILLFRSRLRRSTQSN